MSENLDHHLDERLRAALHDLDRRIARHLHEQVDQLGQTAGSPPPPPAGQPRPRPRRTSTARRLVPVLAGFAVVALLITVGWLARPSEPTGPAITPPTPTATSSASSTPDSPSQSPADAARDGVNPALARLPLAQRIRPLGATEDPLANEVTAPEGVWQVSQPDLDTVGNPDNGCLVDHGKNAPEICFDYGEILLLSPDRRRIIRAFPFPNLSAQWVVLTPDAVYGGRQGDGAVTDSMVVRIDRSTYRLTGRVFPLRDNPDAPEPHTFDGWTGTWSNNSPTSFTHFGYATLSGEVLKIHDYFRPKAQLRLDPITLKPLS